ncbi:MAG: MOSC domain-containing protein [bacterium]
MGRVVAIHIASKPGDDPFEISEAVLVPGRGIEGDRKYLAAGEKGLEEPGRAVTFIESEALAAIRHESDIELSAAASRRNVLTERVALNHLVGRRFRVGGTELEGFELCEPCRYLQELNGIPNLVSALLHRGGLRARIVKGGTIRPGDPIEQL